MKIIELQASNLLRLSAVEIRPDSALVQITGRNGAGKTSCLQAIWFALGGTRNLPTKPIRNGEERAFIKLDMGELIVTRTFNAKDDGGFTTSLKVEAADGSSFKSPQAVLDSLVGEFSFDPLAFTRMDPKAQVEALRAFVPDVDFEAIEKANDADYQTRRDVNRRAADLKARAEAIKVPSGKVPAVVDLVALEGELERAGQHNGEVERRRAVHEGAVERVQRLKADIERLQNQLRLEEAALTEIAAPGDLIDTSAIRQKIADGRAANEHARQAQQRAELLAQEKSAAAESDALTKAMKDRTAKAAAAVAKAKMPVPGLGFGEGHITLNGVPFDQGSDAEQLRAAIAIAGALNSKLRVVRVRDGSLIDEDGMKALAEYAEANDLQVWAEVVGKGGPHTILIEDGHVVDQDAGEVEEAV